MNYSLTNTTSFILHGSKASFLYLKGDIEEIQRTRSDELTGQQSEEGGVQSAREEHAHACVRTLTLLLLGVS
jgi:hypothetical protein